MLVISDSERSPEKAECGVGILEYWEGEKFYRSNSYPVLHYGPKHASLLFVGMRLQSLCDSSESQLTSSPCHTHLFMLVLILAVVLVPTCRREGVFPHADLLVRGLSLAGVAVPGGGAHAAVLVAVAGGAVAAVLVVVRVQVRGVVAVVVFVHAVVLVLIAAVVLRGVIPRGVSRRLADLLLLLLLFALFALGLLLRGVGVRGGLVALLGGVAVPAGVVARVARAVVLVPVRARVLVVLVPAALVVHESALLLQRGHRRLSLGVTPVVSLGRRTHRGLVF